MWEQGVLKLALIIEWLIGLNRLFFKLSVLPLLVALREYNIGIEGLWVNLIDFDANLNWFSKHLLFFRLLSIDFIGFSVPRWQLLLAHHSYSCCHLCDVTLGWESRWELRNGLWINVLGIHTLRHDWALIKTLAICFTIIALFRLCSGILETPGLLLENFIKNHGALEDRVVNPPSVEHLVFLEQIVRLISPPSCLFDLVLSWTTTILRRAKNNLGLPINIIIRYHLIWYDSFEGPKIGTQLEVDFVKFLSFHLQFRWNWL